jgi:FkbM family methyltransferase
MTQSRGSVAVFTRANNLVRSTGIFKLGWFRRAFISSYFLYKRLYEDPYGFLIGQRPELFLNGDILDIGANIGYTACLFANAASPSARVYAFEPDQESYNTLVEEIQRRHLQAVIEPLPVAVGSEVGSVEFWHNEEHSADHRVVTPKFKESGVPCDRVAHVAATTVDEFVRLRGLRRIAFVKIDVQGYELAVCQGMRLTLEYFPEAPVSIEYCPDSLCDLGQEPSELLRFFRSRNYQIYVLTRSSLELSPDDRMIERLSESAGYLDLLCMK